MKKSRYRSIIVFLILILSSVTMLFTLVQYFSLENELQSYTYEAPISNFISISNFTMGNKSFLSSDLEKITRDANKIDSAVLGTAGEMYNPPPIPKRSKEAEEAVLTDEEIKEIERLRGIKAIYYYNILKNGQFSWYTKIQDKKVLASPIPINFLQALHPSLAYGRYFTRNDGQSVCIISSSMSKALFGTANSVGKTITVYESGKQSKYKVVGVLSNGVEDSKYIIALPFMPMYGFFIPYNPGVKSVNSKAIYSFDKFNSLLIIPQEGKYNYPMKKIKEILGDNYPYLVSSLPDLMKYSLGAEIRYNRIKTLALVSILTIITALFTLIEFLLLELILRKKEIGIKRALGKTVKGIIWDKIVNMSAFLFVALLVAVVIIKISIPYVERYTKLGYSLANITILTFSQTVHLILSIPAILAAFVTLFASASVAIAISISKVLRNPPAILIKDTKETYKRNSRLALVVVLSLCSATLFTSLSIINVQKNKIITLYNETSPGIIRIATSNVLSGYIPYAQTMNFTYEDYLALKDKLRGKTLVGYRFDSPSSIGEIDSKSFVSISQATEQYPELYNFKVVKGRFIKDSDFNKLVCVVGESLAEENKLKIGSIYMGRTVVGIIKGNNFLVNHTVYTSINNSATSEEIAKTPAGIYGGKGIILLKPINGYSKNDVVKMVKDTLMKRHPGKDAPCVIHLKEIVNSIYQARTGTFIILSIFVLLSLLSAFLSLSALLFIEVIRRTREIGIKKAIGATKKNIVKEFTLNGLKTTIIALTIGIPIGILISLLIEKLKGWNYYIPLNILILVILISLALGFIFSFLPALFASQINPVEAIKSE